VESLGLFHRETEERKNRGGKHTRPVATLIVPKDARAFVVNREYQRSIDCTKNQMQKVQNGQGFQERYRKKPLTKKPIIIEANKREKKKEVQHKREGNGVGAN